MTGTEILVIPMLDNDAGAKTIRDYLKALLNTLWEQGEGFNGKRPLGNSGWKYELYSSLVKSGAIEGEFDEDGCIKSFDEKSATSLISKAIEAL
jgi:hypothetical protein